MTTMATIERERDIARARQLGTLVAEAVVRHSYALLTWSQIAEQGRITQRRWDDPVYVAYRAARDR